MRQNSAIRRRPTRLPHGQQPIGRSTLFYSRARSPILSTQKSGEGPHVPRHQGHRSADDDHRLAAAAELVHENLGTRHFLEAMVLRRFREQYEDALTCFLRDQELAGLDIVTDGDCRFDDDVGGQSWTSYPPNHNERLRPRQSAATPAGRGGVWFARGHILHDYLESRVMPPIVGPVGRGNLQYAAMWKAAQRLHRAAGEVRRGVGGDHFLRGAGPPLQEHSGIGCSRSPKRSNEEYHELATPAAR